MAVNVTARMGIATVNSSKLSRSSQLRPLPIQPAQGQHFLSFFGRTSAVRFYGISKGFSAAHHSCPLLMRILRFCGP
jgi:hypothetical protein